MPKPSVRGLPQYLIPVRVNDMLVQMYLSRYTVSGIASMYDIYTADVLECATDITWLRRAIFRLRDHMYHTANGTEPSIPYSTLRERENALLGLVFVPE
jgi:hypothetical protein